MPATRTSPNRLLAQLNRFQKAQNSLRAKAKKLRRSELQLIQNVGRLLRGARRRHLLTIEHRHGKDDLVTRHPVEGAPSLVTIARERGGTLSCTCSTIKVFRQPDGTTDYCVLVECTEKPGGGSICHYDCSSMETAGVSAPRVMARTRPGRKR
jgi:hypothetical protein